MNKETELGWEVCCGERNCKRTLVVPFSKIMVVELVGDRARVFASIRPVEGCEIKDCGTADACSNTTNGSEIAFLLASIPESVVVFPQSN